MVVNTPNITFIDSDKITIVFSALIINVESINEKYGLLLDFLKEINLGGITNGKLFITAQMMDPPYELIKIINEVLKPLGLENKKDYVLTYERMIDYGVTSFEDPPMEREIPECKNINWLSSEINNVWHNNAVNSNEINYLKSKVLSIESPEVWQRILMLYVTFLKPKNLKYNPTVIKVKTNNIIFKMNKHKKRFKVSKSTLLRYS